MDLYYISVDGHKLGDYIFKWQAEEALKTLPEADLLVDPHWEEDLLKEYPFMAYSEDNHWCYGNCEPGPEGWFGEIPMGWREIVISQLLPSIKEVLEEGGIPLSDIEVHQIKEKLGTLRFYWGFKEGVTGSKEIRDRIRDLISDAERKSSETCMCCGRPGKRKTKGYWISTLCDECTN